MTSRVRNARVRKRRTAPDAKRHGDARAPARSAAHHQSIGSCIYSKPPPPPPLACRLFNDGRCGHRCQRGRFADGNQCSFCHHTCQDCTDEGPSNCTSCGTGTDLPEVTRRSNPNPPSGALTSSLTFPSLRFSRDLTIPYLAILGGGFFFGCFFFSHLVSPHRPCVNRSPLGALLQGGGRCDAHPSTREQEGSEIVPFPNIAWIKPKLGAKLNPSILRHKPGLIKVVIQPAGADGCVGGGSARLSASPCAEIFIYHHLSHSLPLFG